MALHNPHLQKLFLSSSAELSYNNKNTTLKKKTVTRSRSGSRCCSAIAIDTPSSLAVSEIKWGSTKLQGAREEMEDDVVVRSDEFGGGFYYAAVFDGHAGFSSVKFLRDELYKECIAALQGGLLLMGKDFGNVKKSLKEAFENTDARLLSRLDEGSDDESGSTATVAFAGNDRIFVAHVGDSCLVLSRSGKAEVVTSPHRPYGRNRSSLEEIKRIREAGGWIVDGRICGDIAVARAFGDIRFKTKKNEMLTKGLEEGKWSEKFISRIQFKGDLVTATPDIFQVSLGSDSEFMILASDGLWDYINSSDAVNFVRDQLRQHGDVQLACEELGQLALDRYSLDNVSIIIADLG